MNPSSRKAQISQDKLALKSFTQNFSHGRRLTDDQAKSSIYNGVVELVNSDYYHSSNGILLTTNGYVVTCYHCVDDLASRKMYIRTADRKFYPINKICGYNKKSDIALVKAEIDVPAESISYRFVNSSELIRSKQLEMYVRWFGQLKKKRGVIGEQGVRDLRSDNNIDLDNQVIIDMTAKSGDSGGLVVTPQFEIYGVITSSYIELMTFCGKTITKDSKAACTFWFSAIKLIEKVIGNDYSVGAFYQSRVE